ncbi:hypothetical protein N2152v2_001220 [Parachlorella kessleri]
MTVTRAPTARRLKLGNQGEKLGNFLVYLCAGLLGVAVAYAALTARPFKGSSQGDGKEDLLVQQQSRSLGSKARALSTQEEITSGKEISKVISAGGSEEANWFNKLDQPGCKATEELRVCSHRAKSKELADIFPGSLSAYAALWKAKVKCFDIDFVATADGHLLASHPDDLQQALPAGQFGKLSETVGQHTLAAIRQGGADEERYPTMEAVLQVMGKLIESEEDKFWLKEGGHLDYSRLPGIFMDLKGPAFSQAAVQRVAATAEEQRILAHVALFVMGPEQEGVAMQAGYQGPLIRGYADRLDPDPPLTAEGLARYAMLGPSVHMADGFFRRAAELEKPMHVWTVDTPPDLHRALEMGVDSVISNKPLALRQVLFDWRDRCSDIV